MVCECLENQLTGVDAKVFIIEGYPKNQENIDAWNARFSKRF